MADATTERWAKVAQAAIYDSRMSAERLRVLAAIASYADFKSNECYPAVSTIAARLTLSRRMVQLHLRGLEQLGYVRTLPQMRTSRRAGGNGGGSASNRYVLQFPVPPSPPAAHGSAQATGEPPRPRNAADLTSGRRSPIEHGAKSNFAPSLSKDAGEPLASVHGVKPECTTVRNPIADGAKPECRHGAKPGFAQSPQENSSNRSPQSDHTKGAPLRGAPLMIASPNAFKRPEPPDPDQDPTTMLVKKLVAEGKTLAEAWQLVADGVVTPDA
jgi:hypothetical protein